MNLCNASSSGSSSSSANPFGASAPNGAYPAWKWLNDE